MSDAQSPTGTPQTGALPMGQAESTPTGTTPRDTIAEAVRQLLAEP